MEKERWKKIANQFISLYNDPFNFRIFNESYNETFRLAVFGATNQEIADMQGISLSNVCNRFYLLRNETNLSKNDLVQDFMLRLTELIIELQKEAQNGQQELG